MKKKRLPVLLLAVLLVQTGCFSFGGKREPPPPRFAILTERPDATDVVEKPVTNNLFVIGRFKTSRETEGRAIPILDTETGRYGSYAKGTFAFPVDVVVNTATRNWLVHSGKFGTVVDSSIAPRSKKRIILEGWIEQFGLERDHGKWSSEIEILYLLQFPNGTFREIPLAISTSVDTPVRDNAPQTEDVMRAFRRGMEIILENLEKKLEED